MKSETQNKPKPEETVEINIKTNEPETRTFLFFKKLQNLCSLRNISITFATLVLFLVAYFILFPARGCVTSDCVDTLMWAQASHESHSLFNADFNYACLIPFGGQLLMIPFVAIFGVSMISQVLGVFSFFILFTVAFFFMLRQMRWGAGWSCFAVSCTFMTLCGSEKLQEIFFEHIIYYSLGIFFMFVGLALIFKIINLMDSTYITRKFVICNGLLFIWCLLAATDQLEALTLFLVPAISAIIGERFFSFKKVSVTEKLSNLIIVASTVFGTGIGYIVGNILKSGFVAGYESAYSTFSSADTWSANFGSFFTQWSTLLGVNIFDNEPIMSQKGIINLFMLLFSLTLLIVPLIAIVFYPKIKDRASRIVILFHWIMTALIMMGFIFGKLSAANWRLSPIVCTSVLVTIMFCRWVYMQDEKKRLIWIMILPILICGFNSLYTVYKLPANYKQNEGLYSISTILEQNNLTYGYATFWNANALTVISNSHVKVRSITISDTSYQKDTYQSQNKWYYDQSGQTTYFVLATIQEYADMEKGNNELIREAKNTITADNYMIMVFDKNIFTS